MPELAAAVTETPETPEISGGADATPNEMAKNKKKENQKKNNQKPNKNVPPPPLQPTGCDPIFRRRQTHTWKSALISFLFLFLIQFIIKLPLLLLYYERKTETNPEAK